MKKTNKRLFFANLRNEKFLFCCIIAAIIITATIACRKNFSEQTIVNLNEEFSSKTVREWYYASFKASAEFASFDQKKNGLKIPDWKNGIKARIANWDVMEFPLIRAKSGFSIPNATSMTDADCKRIRDASLSRLLFIKWKGQVGVREIEYTPDLNYLKKKPFYGSNVVSVNEMGDFTGTIIVKDWAANIISVQTVVDGKTIRASKKKSNALASSKFLKNGSGTSNFGACTQYCIYQQDCDMTIYGDGFYTNECGPEYNTGECWTEGDCGGGDPNPDPTPCEIYGCPNPDPEPSSTPPNNDDGDGKAEIDDITKHVNDPCINGTLNTVTSSNLSNNITDILYNTFGGTQDFNVNFIDESLNDYMKDATTSPLVYSNGRIDFTITLNTEVLPDASKEYTAATIYHEILHAYLRTGGIASGAGLQHIAMANEYVSKLTSALMSAFPNLSLLDAQALSWGGLQDTPAFDALRISDPALYDSLKLINSQYRVGTKGTPCN